MSLISFKVGKMILFIIIIRRWCQVVVSTVFWFLSEPLPGWFLVTAAPAHLLLVSLVGKLDADVVLLPDLRDDRPLAPDDFRMELGIDGHGDLEAAESLLEGR